MPASEFDLIRQHFQCLGSPRDDVILGIGDDGAVLAIPPGEHLVAAVDTLQSGVHFPEGTAPAAIGHKALAVNLSDLAAMGARPAWALLALSLPAPDEAWLAQFAEGFGALAAASGTALVGGDLTRGPLSVSVTVLGSLPAGSALTRGGARAGDGIYVTGTLGDAAGSLARLRRGLGQGLEDERWLQMRLDRPTPRLAAGQALRGLASSAIDVSDGLLADLGHILEASGCGATLDGARLPLSAALRRLAGGEEARRLALSGGDDYELCFTLVPERESELEAVMAPCGCPVTRIGEIEAAAGIRLRDPAGRVVAAEAAGYRHF